MALYHFEVGIPSSVTLPQERVPLAYTSHAKREATKDRYGAIRLPGSVTLRRFRLIEVEVDDRTGRAVKYVVRGQLDDRRDLVLVLRPQGEVWLCVTVWVNQRTDLHRTLDTSKYSLPAAA